MPKVNRLIGGKEPPPVSRQTVHYQQPRPRPPPPDPMAALAAFNPANPARIAALARDRERFTMGMEDRQLSGGIMNPPRVYTDLEQTIQGGKHTRSRIKSSRKSTRKVNVSKKYSRKNKKPTRKGK
jgi:hypothetical protein